MKQDFDEAAKKVLAWVLHYRTRIEDLPVLPSVNFGDTLAALPTEPPKAPEEFATILRDFEQMILPGITHWQHPSFFGYFPSMSSPPSVLAEIIMAAMGLQCMSWVTSPAATELEIRMMEWLTKAFGLSADFTGSIQDSASSSTMVAMLVAREKRTDFAINHFGYRGEALTAYCSTEAHSSIEKAAKMIGLGKENLRRIPVDQNEAMRLDLLEEAICRDIAEGRTPYFLVGAFGTTGTTAVDDLAGLARLAKRYKLWFHIDAAYAGNALILPEIRPLATGLNEADSVVINAHKWLLTAFDCSTFFIKDTDALKNTFSILPEYLKREESDDVVNFRDWGPGLGRRFRSLKLWFVLRWYGVEGVRALMRDQLRLAETFEGWVRADERFEVVTPRLFNVVCFRVKGANDVNEALLQSLNDTGELFMTHTKVRGNYTLRMVIGQTNVSLSHVERAWALITTHIKALSDR